MSHENVNVEDLIEKIEDWSALPAEPMVSVTISTYNHEKFIRQALDSVLAQDTTYPFEIVVGEDHSTDGTRTIVCEYQRRHPEKIRLRLARENLFSQGIKTGINSACRGKYIAKLEGDDYWIDPHKLQKQVSILESDPGLVGVYHNAQILLDHDGGGRTYLRYVDKPVEVQQNHLPDHDLGMEDIAAGNPICTATVMFRNHPLFIPLHLRDRVVGGDWWILITLAEHGRFRYLDETMSVYRVHAGGVWSSLPNLKRAFTLFRQAMVMNEHTGDRYRKSFMVAMNRAGRQGALALMEALEQGDQENQARARALFDQDRIFATAVLRKAFLDAFWGGRRVANRRLLPWVVRYCPAQLFTRPFLRCGVARLRGAAPRTTPDETSP